MSRRGGCRWAGGATLAVCVGLVLGTGRRAAAQETPREVLGAAQQALAQGAYENAIPHLMQLMAWFGESSSAKDGGAIPMEPVTFNLGLCHFLLGQFGESEQAFRTYLKKYRSGPHAFEAAIYIGDGLRFNGNREDAIKQYRDALRRYRLTSDWKADVFCSIARCHLAGDEWVEAMPVLQMVYATAPDALRRNWAATLMTIGYLKQMDLEKVYRLVPYLLHEQSFASRSVAFNMTALEAADELFADERYREALWLYRLVFPHDVLTVRTEQFLEALQQRVEQLKRIPGAYRELMRAQENAGELESEIKILGEVENYDIELEFRIARAYLETRRYREARILLLHLHEQSKGEQAEESLFLAFHCSTRLDPWDDAFEIGARYMEECPAGTYYDSVSITLGQMRAKREEWPLVIGLLTKALEVSPKHESAAECMFLIGYASFMEEAFPQAAGWLAAMNRRYPGNDREEEGAYWHAMALLFDRKYEEAMPAFDQFLVDFPESPFREDATFRSAVCDYGMSRFREAQAKLEAFAKAFGKSKLLGEAYMMLADVAGYYGEAELAVQRYGQAIRHDLNIELFNYCFFRRMEMMNDLNDFRGIVESGKWYEERNREGANVPLAVYWVGRALWQLDEREGAVSYYRESIEKYGADRAAFGTDMILDEWIGRSRGLSQEASLAAWAALRELLVKAHRQNQDALALRIERAFLYKPGLTDKERDLLNQEILREENIEKAPPAVLEYIVEEAGRQENGALAVKAAETLVRDFPETDYALGARKTLAQAAIERGDDETAMKHLNVIREVFATTSDAAEALLMLGDIHARNRDFDQADACYKDVLSVKEWRGPLWPAALYGRGECARKAGDLARACAYFERIYLMYAYYTAWTAKAYLARAECLMRLHEFNKARETLEDMLASSELAETEQGREAQTLLSRIQRSEM